MPRMFSQRSPLRLLTIGKETNVNLTRYAVHINNKNTYLPRPMPHLPTAGKNPMRLLIICFVGCSLIGCNPPDEIRSYTAPKPPKAVSNEVRFLGAIIPAEQEQSWFVRLLGPASAVDPREADFDAFLSSVQVTKDPQKPITWTVPNGWKIAPVNPNRVVTLTFGTGENLLEMYISNPFGGDNLENINRWRDQFVGIPKIEAGELNTCTREVMLGTVKALRVDLRGPGAAGGPPRGPFQK